MIFEYPLGQTHVIKLGTAFFWSITNKMYFLAQNSGSHEMWTLMDKSTVILHYYGNLNDYLVFTQGI